jgi:quercetin dioxygenase-like cupin family protein
MKVMRIYSDADGVARVEWRAVPLVVEPGGRESSPDFPALRLFFRTAPEGHVNARHHAPQRQLIFVTSGVGQVELDDGTTWRFVPGDVLFAENTSGHGHVTRTLEGTRGFLYVAVPDTFDITRWPLAEG